jgi:hypothetical protein
MADPSPKIHSAHGRNKTPSTLVFSAEATTRDEKCSPDVLHGFDKEEAAKGAWSEWYPLICSKVDRIRYNLGSRTLEVIFKDGQLYSYCDVEPEIFMALLRATNPGGFVQYILIQYGYAYKQRSSGNVVSPPAAPRFDDQPYAIPDDIQELQAKAGRKLVGAVLASTKKSKGIGPR